MSSSGRMIIKTNTPTQEFFAQIIEAMWVQDTNALTISIDTPIGTATFQIEWLSIEETNTPSAADKALKEP